ncbi:carbon-nitrogen hydrolase family protein [candidate division KSB1 bacterium]|nr:carbon-nitrogen hydrolase family protein [candidate division KSB1 bacterium]
MERRDFLKTVPSILVLGATDIKSGEKEGVSRMPAKQNRPTFKCSAIQVKRLELPKEANPFNRHFDRAQVKLHFERNIQHQLDLIRQAGEQGSEIIVTSEDLKNAGFFLNLPDDPELFESATETIPGPTSERLAALARQYNLYLTACYFERAGADFYNTAILLGPNGQLIGKYRKVQIPGIESWRLTPGHTAPVFETDFGRAGFLICYDIVFPELTGVLALNNVDLIFHPTLGFGWTEILGEITVQCRCNDYSVNMIVAKNYGGYDKPGRSMICNARGQIIADAGYAPDAIVSAELDPRQERTWESGSYMHEAVGVESVRGRLFLERCPEIYQTLSAERPTLPLNQRYQREQLLHLQGPQALRNFYEKMKQQWIKEQADE